MNGLFFCTYLRAFDDCYYYDKDQRGMGRRESLVIDLLSSCVQDEEREAFSYGIDINTSTINQYFSGKRIPPDHIRQEKFLNPEAVKYVRDYFSKTFMMKISSGRQNVVKGRIIGLIKKDRTMPVEKRDELLATSERSSISTFLADTLIYAVMQPKPEDKWKFYFPNPPINNLPNLKTSCFIGRDAEISKLKDGFEKGEYYQSISGISGSGKTQLALEYAFWEFDGYDYIWWIDCETENTILASYAVIAERLKLQADSSNPALAMREVQSWCQNNGFWLMIFDNVQYGKTSRTYNLKDYIPLNIKNGHVLYTTLNDVPYRDERMLHLGLFDEQSGEDFVFQRLNLSESSPGVRMLVNRLGGLPLGLEEACAFLKTISTETIPSYIEKLDKYHIGFGDDLFSNSTHEQTLLEVTELSLQHIRSKDAKLLLATNSFFKDQGMNMWIFHMAKSFYDKDQEHSELFQKLVLEDLELSKAMVPLREFSLCRPVIEDTQDRADPHFIYMNQLYCHKLTQEIVREHFAEDNEPVIFGIELCHAAIGMCSAMTSDYYTLVPDLISFLENAECRFRLINDVEILEKIARIFRYVSWALSDNDPKQKWLWDNYAHFTEKSYGFESVQTAYAYLEYFELFAEIDYTSSFRRLNDAFMIIRDLNEEECVFSHNIYQKREGYPSICLGSKDDNICKGYNQMKLIADAIAGAALVSQNEDTDMIQKYTNAQQEWLLQIITSFTDGLNAQRDENDELISPDSFLEQLKYFLKQD